MKLVAYALAALILLTVSPSSAQPADDVEALEQQLTELADALDTKDCEAACAAIASMRAAADRICELEPGPRCDAARERVEAARQKVLAACPDCEAAAQKEGRYQQPSSKTKPEEDRHDQTKKEPPSEPDVEADADDPVMRSDPDGGCGACTVGARPASDAGWLWLLLAVVLARRVKRYGAIES